MYTYRKKIEKSHSATTGTSTIDILNLSSFAVGTIADIEVKVTLYDVVNEKSSIVYHRTVDVIDPSNSYYAPLVDNDSSFKAAEIEALFAARVENVYYQHTSMNIYIEAFNNTSLGTLNTICVIDYKINFY